MSLELLPNQHCDDSDLVTAANTLAICHGVLRSGSSYVWQLLCDCFGHYGVVKTHSYLAASTTVPTFCTYRDFRDARVSGWRMANPGRKQLTHGEIRQYCASMPRGHLDKYAKHVPSHMFLRYEDFITNPDVILQSIRRVRDVDEQQWRKSLADHGIERNREISSQLTKTDHNLLLMPGHVHEGEVGTWRRFVDEEGAELMTELLRPELERWGYLP